VKILLSPTDPERRRLWYNSLVAIATQLLAFNQQAQTGRAAILLGRRSLVHRGGARSHGPREDSNERIEGSDGRDRSQLS